MRFLAPALLFGALQFATVHALTFDLNSTAFLFLDNLVGIFELLGPGITPPSSLAAYLNNTLTLLNATYTAKGNASFPAIAHSWVGVDGGIPEISPRNVFFSEIAPSFPIGSNATQFAPGFEPQKGGISFYKPRFSPVFGSRLPSILYATGVETVVVTGLTTTGAVLGAVVDLADRDYSLYVVADCVVDNTPEITNATLSAVSNRATIISLAEALSALG